jgi:ATP adenylyltransferase
MIAPYRHVGEIQRLSEAEALDMFRLLRAAVEALSKSYSPSGYNIGLNIGRASGAGIPGHIHLHIVPRWVGDTNFMPVTADTKVIPESLESSYNRIFAALPEALRMSVRSEG